MSLSVCYFVCNGENASLTCSAKRVARLGSDVERLFSFLISGWLRAKQTNSINIVNIAFWYLTVLTIIMI